MLFNSAQRTRGLALYLTAADFAAIRAALEARWPEMRFLENWYWEPYQFKEWRPPPAEFKIPYIDEGWGSDDVYGMISWLEPAGWEARWSWCWDYPGRQEEDSNGFYTIENSPRLHLTWYKPSISARTLNDGRKGFSLHGGNVQSAFLPFDHAHRSFIGKAWRLLEKFTVNKVPLWNYVSHCKCWVGPIHSSYCRIGHDALRWLEESPLHALDGHLFRYEPPDSAPCIHPDDLEPLPIHTPKARKVGRSKRTRVSTR